MDQSIERHLDNWLESQVSDTDARERVKTAMVKEYADDPELWHRIGWGRLFEQVKGWQIVMEGAGYSDPANGYN